MPETLTLANPPTERHSKWSAAPYRHVGRPLDLAAPKAWQPPEFCDLVARIQSGDHGAFTCLSEKFARGLRLLFIRQLGPQDSEDLVQQTLLVVLKAIRDGKLRQPECLPGFVRTVAHREIAGRIAERTRVRATEVDIAYAVSVPNADLNGEDAAFAREKVEIMRRVLLRMPERRREILRRFYLLGHSEEQIRAEMGLTATQFRLYKSRAKAQFGKLGKRLIKVQHRR